MFPWPASKLHAGLTRVGIQALDMGHSSYLRWCQRRMNWVSMMLGAWNREEDSHIGVYVPCP